MQNEIEYFFNNCKSATLSGKDTNIENGEPLLFLHFYDYSLYIENEMHKKISNYFIENISKLLIFINSDNIVTKLSFVNIENANCINIEDIKFIGDIDNFVLSTSKDDQIVLLTALINDNKFFTSEDTSKHAPPMLYGYSLHYI